MSPMALPRRERCAWCPPRSAPQECFAVSTGERSWFLCAEHVEEFQTREKERTA